MSAASPLDACERRKRARTRTESFPACAECEDMHGQACETFGSSGFLSHPSRPLMFRILLPNQAEACDADVLRPYASGCILSFRLYFVRLPRYLMNASTLN
jgi:hypothetical protein